MELQIMIMASVVAFAWLVLITLVTIYQPPYDLHVVCKDEPIVIIRSCNCTEEG